MIQNVSKDNKSSQKSAFAPSMIESSPKPVRIKRISNHSFHWEIRIGEEKNIPKHQ